MGQLPADRVHPAPPFAVVGLISPAHSFVREETPGNQFSSKPMLACSFASASRRCTSSWYQISHPRHFLLVLLALQVIEVARPLSIRTTGPISKGPGQNFKRCRSSYVTTQPKNSYFTTPQPARLTGSFLPAGRPTSGASGRLA